MKRALVTLAVGPHAELLDIAMPSFEEFAGRHGYDVVRPELTSGRPPSWWKVPALIAALGKYDEALWIDADVVIVDSADDMPVPADAWQAVVEHETGDGLVPNMGVWLVRKPMTPFLRQAWAMTEFVHHPWWEQAAIVKLMGYAGGPLGPVEPTELYRRTCFLEQGWNCHLNDRRPVGRPRFMHATMHPDRAAVMREWAAAA